MVRRLFPMLLCFGLVAAACSSTTTAESPVEGSPIVVAETSETVDSTDAGSTELPTTTVAVPSTEDQPPPATTTSPTTSSTAVPSTAAPPPTTPATTTTAPPSYVGAVRMIDAATEALMTPTSFRDSCPVGIDELRLVEVSYFNYQGEVAAGQVVVHQDHADGIAQVFAELFVARFPMQSVDLVDVHGGSDQASMRANNTSAFNCREVAYRPGVWSNHAFGTAIDINPLVNPYVRDDFVDPETGRAYADRTAGDPGMILADDVVVRAFERIGWSWGGYWTTAKDYQHFSASGS